MRVPRLALVVAAFVVTLAAVAAFRFSLSGEDAANVVLAAGDTSVVAAGAEVYARECASCHGVKLEGQSNWKERHADGKLPAPPHDENGHTWHHSDAQLFDIVKNGLPKEIAGKPYPTAMPAYGDRLTDADIVAVLSYIKSRWPAEIQARQDAVNIRLAAAMQALSR